MLRDFGQVLTAMVTPFDASGKVDLGAARELAQMLINSGSDGIVVAGTTGEGPVIQVEEKLRLFEAVKEAVGDNGYVLANTGNYNTAESMALSREAESVGVDGVMLVVPYYNKPSQEGLYQHFKTVAQAIKLPVLLYNVPSRTVRNMEPETVKRLAAIDNIVAIKEASGDMDQATELCNISPVLKVYSGDDSLTLPMLAVGGHGVVSVAGHLVGKQIKEMITAFVSGDIAKARGIHQELYPLAKAMFLTTNPVPVKTAMKLLGYPVGEVKLPLVPLNEQELATLKAVLKDYGLLK
ncbi:MAG: 4-hydroxy-tetrahydrodipicolinate synthase [Clostridia bacterium]|nr:4-hydroxy-tetrahydrodipicolinate synthase [Clostridia bacterium]